MPKRPGTQLGFGPRLTKHMTVRGLDKSPSPLKYRVGNTQSDMRKTFGIPYEKYVKAVVPGDKQADRANPGPGTYLANLITAEKRENSKCGMIGL